MATFRIGVGKIGQESNSFSSDLTGPEDYAQGSEIVVGAEVLHQSSRDEITGFMDVLGPDRAVETIGLISASALPSGCATDETVQFLKTKLRDQMRQSGPFDGICFALHGANSAVSVPDLDGYFIKLLRDEAGPQVPLICTLDMHAIVTRQMLDLADAFFAYRTHPHVDLVETGRRAARVLVDRLRGKCRPRLSARRIPLLLPPPDAGTRTGPLKELFDILTTWDEMTGVLGGSLCCSFPWQDSVDQGWTAMAVTDGAPLLGETLVRQLAEQAWAKREQLLPEPMVSPEEAIRRALDVPGGPIVITDSADTIGAGAPGDNVNLLHAAMTLRHKAPGLILLHLPDFQAIAAIKNANPRNEINVEVGGKRDTRFSCPPVTIRGHLACITDGRISDDGRFGTEPFIDAGTCALVVVDNLRLVLSERKINGPQPSLFRKVGLEPFQAKVVILKTGVGFKVTFGHVAKAVFRADCPGAASYNLGNYDFRYVPRPIFPLDRNRQWSPGELPDFPAVTSSTRG